MPPGQAPPAGVAAGRREVGGGHLPRRTSRPVRIPCPRLPVERGQIRQRRCRACLAAPDEVNRPTAGGGSQPCAGLSGRPSRGQATDGGRTRPAGHPRRVEVAGETDQPGEYAAALAAKHLVEDGSDHSLFEVNVTDTLRVPLSCESRSLPATDHIPEMEPSASVGGRAAGLRPIPTSAPGHFAAHLMASSRLATSKM